MDVKKAISLLSLKKDVARKLQESWKGVEYCPPDGVVASAELFYYQHKEYADALDLAIAALKLTPEIGESDFRNTTKLVSMPESGEPLSLEQLKKMDGESVYLKIFDEEFPFKSPAIIAAIGDNYITFVRKVMPCMVSKNCKNYGKTWLAYSYPPAHIDRSEWTAEWVPMTDDDGCVWLECSTCEYDLDSLEESHPFCPSCGRAMTEEAWAELERRLSGENS